MYGPIVMITGKRSLPPSGRKNIAVEYRPVAQRNLHVFLDDQLVILGL
jgi:hypothetical protein